jgi:hypothetical protein
LGSETKGVARMTKIPCDMYKTPLCYYYREKSENQRDCKYKSTHNVICQFECQHEFKKLNFFIFNEYSSCEKCRIMRHDQDGDLFMPDNLQDAYRTGRDHKK